tara:strand:+ start:164 stop:355 length:192 start_codon:yes stop_codon:yes gene_type:complete
LEQEEVEQLLPVLMELLKECKDQVQYFQQLQLLVEGMEHLFILTLEDLEDQVVEDLVNLMEDL